MKTAFADTSLFVAFLSSDDVHHEQAKVCMVGFEGRITTTHWVLAELGNYLGGGASRGFFAPFVAAIERAARFQNLPADAIWFERGLALYASREDKAWSMVDCISFAVMRDAGLSDALTADRHFEQAGFRAILR